jgi:hypothetical protein
VLSLAVRRADVGPMDVSIVRGRPRRLPRSTFACRVECRKNVVELIVRRRPVPERQESAEKFDLLVAIPRNINDGFRSRTHCEQAQ